MEEFLLTREPLSIVRISTALFVREGGWTGVLKKEVENFENVLQKVLERVPSDDIERIKKLRSFSTGKKLANEYGDELFYDKYMNMMYIFRVSCIYIY